MDDELLRLADEAARLSEKIKLAEQALARLEGRYRATAERILQYKLASGHPLGRRQLKNDSFYEAFNTITAALSSGSNVGGLRSDELLSILRQNMPDLKETTFRGYLHKLKALGFIEKRGAYWRPIKLQAEKA